MATFLLKNPPETYPKRFNRFLWLLISVKGLKPHDLHLWQVMDGTAFQDTETALETELFNEGKTLDADKAERLTLAVMEEDRARKGRGRMKTKAAND